VFVPQRTFGTHLDKVPFDEPLKDVFKDGRIIAIGFNIWEPDKKNLKGFSYHTAATLGFNYPTLWGLYAFAGYDPLVSKAVKQQKPFILLFPDSFAGKNMVEISKKVIKLAEKKTGEQSGIKEFFNKFLLFAQDKR
jgi:hypothetical protein